jgi:hypothetical protein
VSCDDAALNIQGFFLKHVSYVETKFNNIPLNDKFEIIWKKTTSTCTMRRVNLVFNKGTK